MNTINNLMALHDEAAGWKAKHYWQDDRGTSESVIADYEKRMKQSREALRTALTEAFAKDVSLIDEGNKAQPVREPSCDTCKHYTVASQDSFEETCFICSHYYDSKYEVKTCPAQIALV